MQVVRVVLISLVLLGLQSWGGLALRQIEPGLLLLWILFLSTYYDAVVGMFAGFILGLCIDSMQVAPVYGLSSLIWVLSAYLPRLFGGVLFLENRVAQWLLLAAAHGIMLAVKVTVIPAVGEVLPRFEVFVLRGIGALLYDAILLAPLYALFRFLLEARLPAWSKRIRSVRVGGK